MKNKYFFLVLILATLFVTCKNKNDQSFESIDLSIQYKHQINSFKIEKDGNVLILEEKLQKEAKLYNVSFNQTEMDSIENAVNQVRLIKCDTLYNPPLSRSGYRMIVNNKTDSIIYIYNTCEQQKLVDDLVSYIEQISGKKKKIPFYKSLLSPPPLPE